MLASSLRVWWWCRCVGEPPGTYQRQLALLCSLLAGETALPGKVSSRTLLLDEQMSVEQLLDLVSEVAAHL